jgi:hypothetical protein
MSELTTLPRPAASSTRPPVERDHEPRADLNAADVAALAGETLSFMDRLARLIEGAGGEVADA